MGSARVLTPQRVDPSDVIEAIIGTVRTSLEAAGANGTDLAGIGVGTPGEIDEEAGVVLLAANVPGFSARVELGALSTTYNGTRNDGQQPRRRRGPGRAPPGEPADPSTTISAPRFGTEGPTGVAPSASVRRPDTTSATCPRPPVPGRSRRRPSVCRRPERSRLGRSCDDVARSSRIRRSHPVRPAQGFVPERRTRRRFIRSIGGWRRRHLRGR